ncbi:MAG: hypothetical protein HFI62_09885 [Lachnospiraceae bacterium]|jgi:hypothetical protein|nr:hypothetical protein [Lachnospiraceae bacterium]
MKILKSILAGIAVLTALMCILILLCALNPKITEKLSGLVSRDAPQTQQDEVSQSEEEETFTPDEEQEKSDSETEEASEPKEEPEEEIEEPDGESRAVGPLDMGTPGEAQESDVVKGTNGYEVPSESGVNVPEAVSGKSGYQPITEKSEQLPDVEDGEYVSDLGYGELGDGYDFDPLFYPYYAMLDDKGKHLYRQIFANANAFNGAFQPIEAVPVSEIKNAIMAVYNDHPELFWLNTAFVCKYDKDKICAELELEFSIPRDEFPKASAQFYNTVNSMLTQVENLSNYEKELRTHDYLIDKIEYDKGAAMNQSAYSALVEGKSVCAGYARAFQYLMQRMGIPCYYCTGFAGEDHAWNIVALEDGYYNVDVTWDDTPGGEHDYFNKSDQDFESTHVRRDLSINLPKCEGQRYRSL